MALLEPPRIYHYVLASGLVDEKVLDNVFRELFVVDAADLTTDSPQSVDVTDDPRRRMARLKTGLGPSMSDDLNTQQKNDQIPEPNDESSDDESGEGEEPFSEETLSEDQGGIDEANATLDGESGAVAGFRVTEQDHRLVDELVRQGLLNHWQSVQLLEGRTKFTLGDYRIIDAIGRGGYGHVFLGQKSGVAMADRPDEHDEIADDGPDDDTADKTRDRASSYVAIKVLPLARATAEITKRFLHEIDVQKNRSHKNIVRYVESGRDGNVDYMVHEFADGGDLKKLLLREGPLPVEMAAGIVSAVGKSLQYLHENSIVHRDVKPGNILLFSSGVAKLADMGLALPYDRQAMIPRYEPVGDETVLERQLERATKTGGKIAGTIDYMAPDQIRNPKEPMPGWDVYSLGCTFYQILTGTIPFPRKTLRQKLRAHLGEEPPDPRVFNQSIPYDIVSLIRQMMRKDPKDRIRVAWEVIDRLAAWVPPAGLGKQLVFKETEKEVEPPFVPFIRKVRDRRISEWKSEEKTVIVIPGRSKIDPNL